MIINFKMCMLFIGEHLFLLFRQPSVTGEIRLHDCFCATGLSCFLKSQEIKEQDTAKCENKFTHLRVIRLRKALTNHPFQWA